jgi:disulfide bond formation protein DsbB
MKNIQTYAFFLMASFSAALLFALGAEYFFDVQPCQLCNYQRYIMLGIIATGFAITLFKSIKRPLILATIVLMVGGFGLAVYHIGVEEHWWKGPETCSADSPIIDPHASIADKIKSFKAALAKKSTQIVRCDEVNWTIFYVSATWLTALFYVMVGFASVLILNFKNSVNWTERT